MLNVMTWNVKHNTPAADVIAEVGRLVRQYQVDVVCLQEVRRGRLPRHLAKALGMEVAVAWHPLPSGEGLAILSRFPIVGRQRQRLNWHRRYLQVDIQVALGREINIGCLHVSAFALEKRHMEVAQATVFLPRREAILAGDFNLEPDDPVILALRHHLVADGAPGPTQGKRKTDHVFTTTDLVVVNSQTVHTSISDHNPVLVRVG